MHVSRLTLKDFGAFASADIELGPGVNVFLGANATGKTHAMKALYASLRAAESNGSALPLRARLKEKLARVFLPADAQIGRLTRRKAGQRQGAVRIVVGEVELAYTIYSRDSSIRMRRKSLVDPPETIFLPARELLAMYEGFAAAYRQRELSFDETYYDGCIALSAAALRGARPEPLASIQHRLEKLQGGKAKQRGERFYVGQLEAHLVAEGHRQLAVLSRLIANGGVQPGRLLFWDEPEANLNPQLIGELAEIVAEIATAGVQVICASHDYLFTQTLSLLEQTDHAPIRYFAFLRGPGGVTVSAADALGELPENLIRTAFLRHFDHRRQALDSV